MTVPEDLPRLLDDPGESSGDLGLGLERMSSNLPSPETLARMGARLGVTPTGAPVNGGSTTGKTLAKIAGGAGISGVVLFALLRGTSPEPAVTPTASPSSPAVSTSDERSVPRAPNAPTARSPRELAPSTPGAPSEAVSPPAEPDVAPPTAPSRAGETVTAPRAFDSPPRADSPRADETPETRRAATPNAPSVSNTAPATRGDVDPPPAKPPVAPPPTETALLRDARLALNGDPARALALTEQHRHDYPNGGFSQEREVIAITALSRLGRSSEAKSRADRFRSAHPTSPYIDRVNRAVPP